ncbi:Mitochondrial division 1 [Gossypium arboreum]|uniref:Mitochondrial division 1 n=1 Tax=Gossypium arboreum TaxID=29729 RepID=A0A0B0MD02_GOSAR|nr:uncharacterized protein LOC108469820 [Gossypium arboreum]KHF98246.1 Mitochondrial division 1 [Gossypium arboreum]
MFGIKVEFTFYPRRKTILHPRRKVNMPKKGRKSMETRMKAIKREMREISKEQESIKEGDSQVGAKLQAINDECQQLRRETDQIIQKAANSEIRLALMFQILKAREEGDFAKAHQLTALLREVVAMDELIAQIES